MILTWKCHACGDERPDSKVSVAHVPLPGLENAFPETRQNVRYCNDRPACAEKAKLGFLRPGGST